MRRSLIFFFLLGMASAIPNASFGQPDTLWTKRYRTGGNNFTLIKSGISYAIGTFAWAGNQDRNDWDFTILKLDSSAEIEWQRFYAGMPEGHHVADQGRAIRQMPDSGFVHVGWTSGGGMMVRTDPEGELIWQRYMLRDDELFVRDNCTISADGNIVVVGSNQVAKFSDENDGEEIWRQTYQNAISLLSVQSLNDGGFIFVGRTTALGARRSDMFACRIDSDGEMIWENAYGTEFNDYCWEVIEIPDDGFCLAGVTEFGGDTNEEHALLVRIDADGNEIWQRYDEEEQPGVCLRGVVGLPDGGVTACGYYDRGFGARRPYLLRLDYFGEVLWRKTYRGPIVERIEAGGEYYSVLLENDNSYFLGGFSSQGIYLIRTQPDTLVIPFELEVFSESYDFDSVMVDSLVTAEIALHNFGRRPVVVDSVTFEGDSSHFAYEIELPHRLNPSDTLSIPIAFFPTADTTYSATLTFWYADTSLQLALAGWGVTPNSIENEMVIPHEFVIKSVYPNPFNARTSVAFSLPEAGLVRVGVYDSEGRLVADLASQVFPAGRHSLEIDFPSQVSGVYFLKIEANGLEQTRKLILMK